MGNHETNSMSNSMSCLKNICVLNIYIYFKMESQISIFYLKGHKLSNIKTNVNKHKGKVPSVIAYLKINLAL